MWSTFGKLKKSMIQIPQFHVDEFIELMQLTLFAAVKL